MKGAIFSYGGFDSLVEEFFVDGVLECWELPLLFFTSALGGFIILRSFVSGTCDTLLMYLLNYL
jgi:hypothetical protein